MGKIIKRTLTGLMMLASLLVFIFSYNLTDVSAVVSPGYVNGILGQYYDTADASNISYERLIRIDDHIAFNWMEGSPDASIEPDTFSVAWSGYIEVPTTGNYDFYTYSDDGVQLTIGSTIIDRWGLIDLEFTKSNQSIYLEQGVKYPFSLKYQELPINSTIFLFWEHDGQDFGIVPPSAFYVCQGHYNKYQSPVQVNCLQANGDGLKGEYFEGAQKVADENSVPDYTSPDGHIINFDWGLGSPNPNISADDFSACWTGYLEAKFTEPVTLQLLSDDGVRMWINDELVLDKWGAYSQILQEATINMESGKFYKIKIEYNDLGGGATCKLYWQSAGQEKEIIPLKYLYSSAPNPTLTGGDPDPGPCSFNTDSNTIIGIAASDDSVGMTGNGYGNHAIDSSNPNWQIQLNNATLQGSLNKANVTLTGLPSGLDYDITRISDSVLQITLKGIAAEDINSKQTVQLKVLASAVTSVDFVDSTEVPVYLVPPAVLSEYLDYSVPAATIPSGDIMVYKDGHYEYLTAADLLQPLVVVDTIVQARNRTDLIGGSLYIPASAGILSVNNSNQTIDWNVEGNIILETNIESTYSNTEVKIISQNGDIIINNCCVEGSKDNNNPYIVSIKAPEGTIYANGTTILSKNDSSGVVELEAKNDININAASITSTGDKGVEILSETGKIDANNAVIKSSNSSQTASVIIQSAGKIILDGATVESKGSCNYPAPALLIKSENEGISAQKATLTSTNSGKLLEINALGLIDLKQATINSNGAIKIGTEGDINGCSASLINYGYDNNIEITSSAGQIDLSSLTSSGMPRTNINSKDNINIKAKEDIRIVSSDIVASTGYKKKLTFESTGSNSILYVNGANLTSNLITKVNLVVIGTLSSGIIQ